MSAAPETYSIDLHLVTEQITDLAPRTEYILLYFVGASHKYRTAVTELTLSILNFRIFFKMPGSLRADLSFSSICLTL